MSLMLNDIKQLPPPQVIADLDFKAILENRKALLNQLQPLLFDDQTQPVILSAEYIEDETGKYWRVPASNEMGLLYLTLSSEPMVKQLEVASYLDLLNIQRINHAATSNLLSFASGARLDHEAIKYGIKRLNNETDDALLQRIILSIRGYKAGTLDYYEFETRSAAAGIRDVDVSMPSDMQDAVINITIMAETETGEASTELLQTIRNHTNQKNIKLNNDVLNISSVQLVPVILKIIVYPHADALPDLINHIETQFKQTFEQHRGLKIDINRTWVIAQHQVTGVQKVELDWRFDYHIEAHQCAVLQQYEIINGGVLT